MDNRVVWRVKGRMGKLSIVAGYFIYGNVAIAMSSIVQESSYRMQGHQFRGTDSNPNEKITRL